MTRGTTHHKSFEKASFSFTELPGKDGSLAGSTASRGPGTIRPIEADRHDRSRVQGGEKRRSGASARGAQGSDRRNRLAIPRHVLHHLYLRVRRRRCHERFGCIDHAHYCPAARRQHGCKPGERLGSLSTSSASICISARRRERAHRRAGVTHATFVARGVSPASQCRREYGR
jgi:hypothetical protein